MLHIQNTKKNFLKHGHLACKLVLQSTNQQPHCFFCAKDHFVKNSTRLFNQKKHRNHCVYRWTTTRPITLYHHNVFFLSCKNPFKHRNGQVVKMFKWIKCDKDKVRKCKFSKLFHNVISISLKYVQTVCMICIKLWKELIAQNRDHLRTNFVVVENDSFKIWK